MYDPSKQAITATQRIDNVEKREENGYAVTFEGLQGQVVGKKQISPSGCSNLEQVVKERKVEHTVGTGTGEDVQRESYRNQDDFIMSTSEVENLIVTIKILPCRKDFLPV